MIYQVKGISGHQWVCVGCVHVSVGVCGGARVCAGVHRCAWVCAGMRECARVRGCGRVCVGMCGSTQVCAGVHWCVRGYAWVYACVWDEFSEFLLENRVPTSADFNTYPIRIFYFSVAYQRYIQYL